MDSRGEVSRILRLHSFEFLIFSVLFTLLALCLATAAQISTGRSG